MLIFSLFLVGYCISLTKISHWKIETTPFFVLSSLVLLLYGFAYVNQLLLGAWILSGLGAFSTFYAGYVLCCDKKSIFEKYLTPGFVIPLLFLILMCVYSFFMLPSLCDEFTHWGPHNILFHYNNGFPSAKDVLIHQDYPPAGELFHYLFIFNGPFSISNVYVAQTIMTLAPLTLLYQRFTWSQWYWVFWLLVLVFSILSILHADVGPGKTLYMDTCVGIYWGSLVAYFILSEKKPVNIFYLFPIAACFVLLKLGLMPLLLIATVLIMTNQWINNPKRCLLILLLPLVGWLSLLSWLHYLHIAQIKLEWTAHPGLKEVIKNFLNPQFYRMHALIFDNFICHTARNLVIPAILFLAAMLLATFSNEKIRREIISVQILIFLGYFAFLFGLLFLYLYTFTDYEAVRLASYERYVMIYLVGWAILGLAQFSYFLSHKKVGPKKWLIIITLALIPVFLFVINHDYNKKTQALNSEHGIWNAQKAIKKITDPVIKLTPSNARIATIWQESEGLERAIIVYQLMPRRPNLDCNSYGDKYNSGDVWTCQVSKAQFLKNMSNMDYVLLAHTDKNFWSHYASLFPRNKTAFVAYSYCLHEIGSNAHCSMQTAPAYLYKIIKMGNQIRFQLIIPGAE